MKKSLLVILTLAIIASTMPVFADQADEMQKVLLMVKERIINTEAFEEFDSSVMEADEDKQYSFNWSSNTEEAYKSLSVTATDSGIITNYRYYDDNTYSYNVTPSIKKMSSDDALIKVQKLIDELNPMLAGEFKVIKTGENESLFDNTFHFNLQRYENSIPVYNDSGFVTVNADASMITRYSINYTQGLSFDSPQSIISTLDAWKYYYENAGAELEYRIEYKDMEKEIYLVYIPQLGSEEYIDAKTGEVIPIWHRDYYYFSESMNYAAGMKTMDAAVEESARLSEIEIEKIQEVAGLMSADDAKNAVINNELLDFDDDLSLNSVNLYEDYNGERYFYDLTFESNADEVYRYASATLDAKTLEIIRWRAHTNDYIEYYKADENLEEIDKEDVYNKALEALKVIAPEYFSKDTEYKLTDIQKTSNSLGYTRYVNDIKFGNDYVNIEINPKNGKVWSFSMNYTDEEFVSPDGIISEEKAIEKMSEQVKMTLYYFPTVKTQNAKIADIAKLGYKNEEISEIDAFTGEVKDYGSKETKLVYTDISGHYAKDQIETLAKFGIGFEGSEYKPDAVITLNEYITLLVSTFSNYTPIVLKASNDVTHEFKEAQRNGIIKLDEANPNKPLTRENAAIYMIRVMGIEEYAKLSGIYKSVFADVSENIGYISILGAMGVFNGDENKMFNPQKNLTRADAAIVIYNYLSR